MKTRIIISLIALMSLELSGQSSDIKVIQNQKIIGQNLLTQQDILAKEYQFPNHIYKRYLDSATGNITLQLRKLSKNYLKIKFREKQDVQRKKDNFDWTHPKNSNTHDHNGTS